MISVLYVDDEPMLLELGKRFLEQSGEFSVTMLCSANSALDLLETTRFDAIISDYQMPGMDGIGFLKEVRTNFGQVPFILFTGKGREEVVILALNSGADYYLQKGGDPRSQFTELAHKIRLAVEKRNTEKALIESEHRYRDVVETQTEFISRFTPDLVQVFVNKAYCRHFSLNREDIVGHRFFPKIPEEEKNRLQTHFNSLTREHPEAEIEHRIIMPDGSTRWHWWNDRAIFGDSGEIIEFQSVGKDITDRKTTEEELQAANEELIAAQEEMEAQLIELKDQQYRLSESEQNYRTIIENIQDVYYRTDREGNLIFASPSLASVLGFNSVEELFGKKIAHTLYFKPEEHERVLEIIRQNGSISNYEVVMKNGDGTPVFVLTSSHPYYSREGIFAGIEGIFRDITERKKIEVALRESENLYRTVFYNTGAATIIIGPDTTILLANTSWEILTGYPINVDKNQASWTQFIHPGDIEMMKLYHNERRKNPERVPKVYECRIIDTGRKVHNCIVYVDIIPGTRNSVASLIDITNLKEAENALRESEEKYRKIIENMQDPYFRTDCGYHILMVNPSFLKQFGFQSPMQVIGRLISDVIAINQQDRTDIPLFFSSSSNSKESRLTLKREGETPLVFSVAHHQLFDSDGRPAGIEGTLHDITYHLRAEEALVLLENKYHELSEMLPQMVFELDLSLQITYANRYLYETLGYTQEDLIKGIPITIIIDPDQRNDLTAFIKRHDPGYTSEEHEFRVISKDKNPIPVLIYVTPVQKNNQISGYCGVIVDISSRKMMQKALEDNERLFREVFHNAYDEIILHEISPATGPGRFIQVNDITCERLGYTRDELMEMTIRDIIPPEYISMSFDLTSKLFIEKEVMFESEHVRKNGYRYPVEVNAHLFRVGEKNMILSISRDITERKQAEEALRKSNNKLNILSSITRHDLLNQLNALQIFLELSKKRAAHDPVSLGYVQKEIEISGIMFHQIGFTKSYQDIGITKPEWKGVDKMVMMAAKQPMTDDIRIESDLEGLEIYADQLVEKVFYNLIDNSIRHGRHVTRIQISWIVRDKDLLIEYRDNGIGVPDDEKELIFTKGFGSNTGWGMFLSREILSITNITIRESGKSGEFALFEIHVPEGSYRFAG